MILPETNLLLGTLILSQIASKLKMDEIISFKHPLETAENLVAEPSVSEDSCLWGLDRNGWIF